MRRDTEMTCHCGAAYGGSDHCPECGCEQYEGGCDHESPNSFPICEPRSPVESELRDAWHAARDVQAANPTPETWQRRIAACAAYEAVYRWNRLP